MATGHRQDLRALAHRVMIERGLLPDFSNDARDQLAAIRSAAKPDGGRDLTGLLWASIDNDDSRDLDQLSVAEPLHDGAVRLLVAIADVDAVVKQGTPIDDHARANTTSVYTAAEIFPMLEERLSTDLTSLNADVVRVALVIEVVVGEDGTVKGSDVYSATVRNLAKLAYDSVAAWLEGTGPMPDRVAAVPGMAEQLRLQDDVAQRLRHRRCDRGALSLETLEARPVFEDGDLTDLVPVGRNRAKDLIEDVMIAANGVTARFLEANKFPSLRRVLRSPERWAKIVAIAEEAGDTLPPEPSNVALDGFLRRQRERAPQRFADLSLSVVKLLGRGEYVLDPPGGTAPGHFGLALRDYTHSTAPNRRFPDLITHRLVKAALAGSPPPYAEDELQRLAAHCTVQEDAAAKVERRVRKSAAVLLLRNRIGQRFDAFVTGASVKGTYVRIRHPAAEGRLIHGGHGLDVGDHVRVELVHTDFEQGFVDFKRV